MKRCHPPKPCNNCPFRRKGGIRLRRGRIIEIVDAVAPEDGQGGRMPCHKTVDHDAREASTELDCTGGLIFGYKLGLSSQMTRISERLGLIDRGLADDPHPEVFDDLAEMLGTALDGPPKRRSRRR